MLGYVKKMQMQNSTETELEKNNTLYHVDKALLLLKKKNK